MGRVRRQRCRGSWKCEDTPHTHFPGLFSLGFFVCAHLQTSPVCEDTLIQAQSNDCGHRYHPLSSSCVISELYHVPGISARDLMKTTASCPKTVYVADLLI